MDKIHQESPTYYDMNGIPNEFLINIKWLTSFTNLQMTNIPHGSYPNINKFLPAYYLFQEFPSISSSSFLFNSQNGLAHLWHRVLDVSQTTFF